MIAPDPFKTETPLTSRGIATYSTIAARLAALEPTIAIAQHLAQSDKQGKTQFSTLVAHDSTLDGIKFIAANPAKLAHEFEAAKDQTGNRALASMKEDPDHWALKLSFGATVGTGWREIWRPAPYSHSAAVPTEAGKANPTMRMRFGTAGTSLRFTALHCALHEIGGQCNIHIDESGFVLSLPQGGVGLTPNLYDHFMNELLIKTKFRDWLSGIMPSEEAAHLVKEAFRRVAIIFPNAANGYAGLDKTINSIRPLRGVRDGVLTAKRILKPIGATFDLYDSEQFKVQVTGTALNGDRSITISVGGKW